MVSLEDAFDVFKKIPGTPNFWKTRRFELIAKLEQLGPFQFFFTLSCADKRWEENITSILRLNGRKITIKHVPEREVFVDNVPLQDYMENVNVHELIQENVLTVTRIFDKRVNTFMSKIVMGPQNPMKVLFYNYRVEFQVRGAGHIHGVLWIDLQELGKSFPGIEDAMAKLKTSSTLNDGEVHVLTKFVDSFVSCSLQSDVQDIVQEVQLHHHSKTCRKYDSTACRFGFPRFPSNRTIIAQPIKESDFSSNQEFLAAQKKHKDILSKVKDKLLLLKDFQHPPKTIDQLLRLSGVSEVDYYQALSVSCNGTVITLKRTMEELFVNNYNPEWIRAWDGNMDLQVCLDYFGIVTYITDYQSKDESGTAPLLKKAAQECKGKSQKEVMYHLANVYLTNRMMGESEAYYRILPSLKLVNSNVKCVYVPSGFPKSRSRFLRAIPEHGGEESEEEIPERSFKRTVTVGEKKQKFTPVPNVIDKYSCRPSALENICLAQFAANYDTFPASSGRRYRLLPFERWVLKTTR